MWEWELAGKQLGEMLGWLLYRCARCEASCICAKHKYQTQSGCLFHSHFAWLWVMGWRPVTERVYGPEMCHMDPKQIDFVALWHRRHHPDTVPPGPWDGGWVCSTAPVAPCSGFWLRAPFTPSLELLRLPRLYLIGNIPLCELFGCCRKVLSHVATEMVRFVARAIIPEVWMFLSANFNLKTKDLKTIFNLKTWFSVLGN